MQRGPPRVVCGTTERHGAAEILPEYVVISRQNSSQYNVHPTPSTSVNPSTTRRSHHESFRRDGAHRRPPQHRADAAAAASAAGDGVAAGERARRAVIADRRAVLLAAGGGAGGGAGVPEPGAVEGAGRGDHDNVVRGQAAAATQDRERAVGRGPVLLGPDAGDGVAGDRVGLQLPPRQPADDVRRDGAHRGAERGHRRRHPGLRRQPGRRRRLAARRQRARVDHGPRAARRVRRRGRPGHGRRPDHGRRQQGAPDRPELQPGRHWPAERVRGEWSRPCAVCFERARG